ncbi:MAG TPA: hypothetical protein VKB36_19955, partial [Vicinamibacterales bacterium]|nr:hypothetical protein [Vicinamibacterales bacterium]
GQCLRGNTGPEGYAENVTDPTFPYHASDAHPYSLLGMVGADVFQFDASHPFTAANPGRLLLTTTTTRRATARDTGMCTSTSSGGMPSSSSRSTG